MLDFIKGNGSEQKSISSLSILENSIGKGYPGLNCTVHLIVILCLLYSIGSCCAVVFCPEAAYRIFCNLIIRRTIGPVSYIVVGKGRTQGHDTYRYPGRLSCRSR